MQWCCQAVCVVGLVLLSACTHTPPVGPPLPLTTPATVYGAEVLLEDSARLAQLRGKRLAVVANATSRVYDRTHLVDTLLALGLSLERVFAPEHGFRGDQEAGDTVQSGRDPRTGLPVVSLYGEIKKPTPESLAGIDVVLFDIQDVGARFYTYLSTLALVQEACAEAGVALWVLDRPNPNGHTVAGPVLVPGWASFVGAHPIPIVHGLTLGEYARLLNGERWLAGGVQAQLTVVPLRHWWHGRHWEATHRRWVPPSPNLPTPTAARLYPALCWFEGTQVSLGRGTALPFRQTGYPGFRAPQVPGTHAPQVFVPQSQPGAALRPLHEALPCTGVYWLGPGFDTEASFKASLALLAEAYRQYPPFEAQFSAAAGYPKPFFNPFKSANPWFEKLTGGPGVRQAIEADLPPDSLWAQWAPGVAAFKTLRAPYLLYPEMAPNKPPT